MPIKLAICNSKVAPGFAGKVATSPCKVRDSDNLQPAAFSLLVPSPELQPLHSRN
jgi:hypothetical protein